MLAKLKASKDNEEIRNLTKELRNKEGVFKVEDTMSFTNAERKLLDDPNFVPSDADLQKRITRIARKAMQFLRKLKVPNEDIFMYTKFHKAMKIKAAKLDDGNFMSLAAS